MYFTDSDLPFGKEFAVRRAERRVALMTVMPVEGRYKARRTQHAFSFTRDLDHTMSSSRHDYRRRDRSWEQDDRDKGRDRDRDRDRDRYSRRRSSRSRSPRRSGMYYLLPTHITTFLQPLKHCATDRRDYGRDRDEDRRDRDSRDSRRRDERDRRDAPRRDGERDRDRDRHDKRDGEKSRGAEHEAERVTERGARADSEPGETVKASQSHGA